MRIILAILVVVVGALAYVRLAPVKLTAVALPTAVGDYPEAGGFTAVRDVSDAMNLATVEAAMLALPRTVKVASDPLTFVTRSRVIGFPDVTVVEERDGKLAISAHLVYGGSDLGVNKARVLALLASL